MNGIHDIVLAAAVVAAVVAGIIGGIRSAERGFRICRNMVLAGLTAALLAFISAAFAKAHYLEVQHIWVGQAIFHIAFVAFTVTVAGFAAGITGLFRRRHRTMAGLIIGLSLLFIPILFGVRFIAHEVRNWRIMPLSAGIAEQYLGDVQKPVGEPYSSVHGLHAAFVLQEGDKQVLAIDGKAGPRFDEIDWTHVEFSDDGKRCAYMGKRSDKEVLVLDDQPGPEYDLVFTSHFSHDGTRVAYEAMTGDLHCVVIDGAPGPKYEEIFYGATYPGPFSPDGRRTVYVGRKKREAFVVLDGEVSTAYEGVMEGSPKFSPDSRRVACVAQKGGKWFVVVDGQAGGEYEGIGAETLTFSSDSQHLAYAAAKDGKWRMVTDGKEGPEHDAFGAGMLRFSADGRFAYVARNGKAWHVIVDGQVSPAFDNVVPRSLKFSADGRHLAYAVSREGKVCFVLDDQVGAPWDEVSAGWIEYTPDGRLIYAAKMDDKWHVVVDGKAGPAFSSLGGISLPFGGGFTSVKFSPDGRRMSYVAFNPGGKASLVLDGDAGPEYDTIQTNSPAFSRDGTQTAYVAKQGEGHLVIVNGQPGLLFDDIPFDNGGPKFSADGKHLIYAAEKANRRFVVVDGKPGPEYDMIVSGGPTFLPDGRLQYLAVRRGKLFRVTHDLNKQG